MIYRFKATFAKDKGFMREYEIDSSMTLFQLRAFLNADLEFTQNQMCMFETYDGKGKLSRRIGLFDMGDGSMAQVTLADCIGKEEVGLSYIYNMDLDLSIDLENIGTATYSPRRSYPALVAEKGICPKQFPTHADLMAQSVVPVVHRDDEDGDEDDDLTFEDSELPEGEEYAD